MAAVVPRLLLVLALASPALAQRTTRVSVSSAEAQGDGDCRFPALTPEGRFVAYHSEATTLVPGDTNGVADVFVRDRATGTTVRASVGPGGVQADGRSEQPSISADGRYVGFWSAATNLVAGDTNGWPDAFVHDLLTGATERISVDSAGLQPNGDSYDIAVSGDGRYVAFESSATNLVPGDTNGRWDIFVRDRQAGTTERISLGPGGIQGDGDSFGTAISADGLTVVFDSWATNLVPNDTNATSDLFLRDLVANTTALVSVSSSGVQANSTCHHPAISSDGRVVAFRSIASNLVPGDTNATWDVFAHERPSGLTRRVSVGSAQQQGDSSSERPAPSADGRFVAFLSHASNLVPGDTNGWPDVFVRDLLANTTERVSVSAAGAQGDAGCILRPSISADGRLVAFASLSSNLVPNDTNGRFDAFVRDRGRPPFHVSCTGDGSAGPCPCGNAGLPGRGCENSAGTGGAMLSASGNPSLAADTLVLAAASQSSGSLSLFLQGNAMRFPPLLFGDGLLCAGGAIERLYVRAAPGGSSTAPEAGDPSISARSAALGGPIAAGATRHYQVHYRDADAAFCPAPSGATWNVTNAVSAVWGF